MTARSTLRATRIGIAALLLLAPPTLASTSMNDLIAGDRRRDGAGGEMRSPLSGFMTTIVIAVLVAVMPVGRAR